MLENLRSELIDAVSELNNPTIDDIDKDFLLRDIQGLLEIIDLVNITNLVEELEA